MNKLELFPPYDPWIVTQGFGGNYETYKSLGLAGHNGMDIAGSYGGVVRAAHNGIVTFSGMDGSAGWGVVIQTEDKRWYSAIHPACYFKTIYWHLLPNVPVRAGQRVRVGDVIGHMGNTGFVYPKPTPQNPTAGTHLHFGLKPVEQGEQPWQWSNIEQQNGYLGAVDPYPYFSSLTAKEYRVAEDSLFAIKLKLESLKAAIIQKYGNLKISK